MKKVNGICLLDNCDIGGTAALAQSIGPFEYSVSCKHKSRNIGLISWCTYNGDCEMREQDPQREIREASKYTNFWRR